jgi:hypothetical protein
MGGGSTPRARPRRIAAVKCAERVPAIAWSYRWRCREGGEGRKTFFSRRYGRGGGGGLALPRSTGRRLTTGATHARAPPIAATVHLAGAPAPLPSFSAEITWSNWITPPTCQRRIHADIDMVVRSQQRSRVPSRKGLCGAATERILGDLLRRGRDELKGEEFRDTSGCPPARAGRSR